MFEYKKSLSSALESLLVVIIVYSVTAKFSRPVSHYAVPVFH